MNTQLKHIPLVIPSYEPDKRLIELIETLNDYNDPIIIVNDGSNDSYNSIFNSLVNKNLIILKHNINKGKGRALKTAFEYIIKKYPDSIGCITADSDGQHSYKSIIDVRKALIDSPDSLIMGVRTFDGDHIPWKSKAGNKITIKVLSFLTGIRVSDTQTGLRGIPLKFMRELIEVPGERFEFETQMLIESIDRYPIVEVPVETIYDSKAHHQSHFNPLKDSFKIYRILVKKFIKYLVSSLSSSVLDIVLFALFCSLFKNSYHVWYASIATVSARLISAVYNYLINYILVFKSKEKVSKSAFRYFILAIVQMLCSAVLTQTFVFVFKSMEVLIKIIVDVFLFFCSYYIQNRFVFKKH